MRIDILYFEGCPNHAPTAELVHEVARALAPDASIHETAVCDEVEATRLRFFGSPTVQVDGLDIDPVVWKRAGHSLSCRLYGSSGVPPRALLERALRHARLRRAG